MKKLALALLVCVLPGSNVLRPVPAPPPQGHQPLAAFGLTGRTPPLSGPVARLLESKHSSARSYRATMGESVDISVSGSYTASESMGQYWANFFAELVHGDELGLLHAFIAPLPEVRALCGPNALGCYGDNQLVMTGDTADGFAPEEVARHEYGHHIAFNRANPPWKALELGPKRWASYAGVCARARAGTAYPGDEGLLYRLNPGEAFAESYRLLNDTRSGAVDVLWPIVDRSFYPDAGALHAVEEDVIAPWTGPSPTVVRRSFEGNAGRIAAFRIVTPLDGTLIVRLRPAGLYDVLVVGDGDPLRATGRAFGTRETKVTYQICGERSLAVFVTAGVGPRFEVDVTRP
jgi:hypothetical protein